MFCVPYVSKTLGCPICPAYPIVWSAHCAYMPKILAFFLKSICIHRVKPQNKLSIWLILNSLKNCKYGEGLKEA